MPAARAREARIVRTPAILIPAMARKIHDHYFLEAKREGYRSRAAYKLIEIDDRRRILARGDRVLDCGAAPGSWLQVASTRVGPGGVVVGVDPTAIDVRLPNVRVMKGYLADFTDEQLRAEAGGAFDVVLSDMAPSTSGDPSGDHHRSVRLVHELLDRAPALLREGGRLVAKVFEGEAYPELLARMKATFAEMKGFKPKASRSESREMFVIGRGYRKPAGSPGPT
jgi:23S rRNA (uridine2552-2'-O)-methyltransferase